MKKTGLILLVLVICLVAAPLFAGGAGEAKQAKVDKLTHWTWSNGSLYTYSWNQFIKDFPAYANVKYEFSSQGGSSQDMMKKIMVSFAANAEVPDVIEMNFKLNPMLVANGVAADITKFVEPFKNEVPEFVWNSAMYKGKMYGVPLRGNSSMMLYREDLLKEAGIDIAKVKTWDDYLAAGKQLRSYFKSKGKDVYMTSIAADKPADYWGEIMLGQHGIGFFDDKTGEPIVDTDPGAIESLKLMNEFVKSDIATIIKELTPPWYGALKEGKIATVALAGWMPNIIITNVPDGAGKWRIAPYPAFKNGKQSMQGIMGYTVLAKDPAKQELAVRVLTNTAYSKTNVYAMEEKNMFNMSLNMFTTTPPNYGALNAYFGGQNVKKIDMDILSNAVLHKYTPAFSEALTIMNIELAKAIGGQKDIDAAIKDMGKEMRLKIGKSLY